MYLMRFDRVSLQKFDAFGATETRGGAQYQSSAIVGKRSPKKQELR